ncbi:hypothetical protein [Nonomuraea rubra]|uniref:Uncharacterized protein n=1 Tax=Nonomuraea rubra TaxID=46180 RepID=A0A7X0P1W0_9ACTN|nr:hypothetical protein [Nonomuraea rubra]MBB6553549.1 hypothetical protein [Nonomuraea rubra]
MPARSLYPGLTAHLNELSTLLPAGLPERLRRRLSATTGEAAVLASRIAWEIKQPSQSAAFDRIADLASQESGHPIVQACSYADLGDRQALNRLEQARDVYAEARPQRERAWTRFLDPARMAAYRLSTYVNLGDENRVITEGQAALNALSYETDHKKIAATQPRIGDLNEGITSGRQALEIAQRTESR